jgi:hypothetical protein
MQSDEYMPSDLRHGQTEFQRRFASQISAPVFAAWGVPAREKEEAFPNRYDPAAQRTLTLDLRYVSRRVQCAYEVEDAGCEKKR